jgi:hypothetical protein
LSSASSLTRFVLKVVRFSVMKILPVSPFRHFLGLYTFSRILYDRKRTITCDLPLWTVAMTYDLINVYWTNDGRIYAKKSESSTKQLSRKHDDILDLFWNRFCWTH